MLTHVIRRILATIPVMAIVALFVFSLLYVAPGDPAAVIAGDQATPADVERIRASLGLDRPFLVRFGEWLWRILHGDLGTSIFTNLPVSAMIAQRLEPTVSLMAVTLVFAVSVAVPIGVVAAWKADTLIDRPHGVCGARLLGCRSSSSAICSPMSLRCSSIGCRSRATPRFPKACGRGLKT
jgi:peptide/nickel transport system permease protein